MSLTHLKKDKGMISKLQNRLSSLNSKKNETTEEYWKLSVDASENGTAEIRLLPAHESEEFPFVKILDYGIGVYHKDINKKKWYIGRSLETIGKPDPVKDEYWALYNIGTADAKEQMKIIRDRTSYIVWIYVIDDKNAPENNGKVMKAKLSPSIWKLIEDKISPQFEDDEPLDVFDLWNGANLKIRAYKGTNGMRSYDKSVWLNPGPLFGDDDKLEEIYNQVKGLNSEVDPLSDHYKKTYGELDAKLESVLGRPLFKNIKAEETNHSAALSDDLDDTPVQHDAYKPKETTPSNDIDDDELAALIGD